MAVALPVVLAACQDQLGAIDSAFYNGDQRRVHCAFDIDTSARVDIASIDTGLDRARDRHEILELYSHNPGDTVPWDVVEHVLAGAKSRGLSFVTYADMAAGVVPAAGGVAYAFDDAYVPAWVTGRGLFKAYDARITFFVAYWDQLSDAYKQSLHDLAADGHDIEAHSVKHKRGPDYVEQHGLDAYMSTEVVPSIEHLRADGFPVTVFAYPFGARTDETDRAILGHVSILRSIASTWENTNGPCPL